MLFILPRRHDLQIPVRDQDGANLTAGVEHGLVDRIPAAGKFRYERIEWNAVDYESDEHVTLPIGQLVLDDAAHLVQEIARLRRDFGSHSEPVGHPLPAGLVQSHRGSLPEVP